nr:GNAT family N-acetyltransferase [Isachenkonia alkalipeptolytica]
MLRENFPESYSDDSLQEMNNVLSKDRIALMAIGDGEFLGFVGAIPQYESTGWELHPLVVDGSKRSKGVGRKLVETLEREVANRGGIMIYLGTDDERFQTSLSDTDLFEDTYRKIENIKNYGNHPYEFYQKLGYQIVGVLPDANGYRKPDILMAKRIRSSEKDSLIDEREESLNHGLSEKKRRELEWKIKGIEDFSGVVSIKKGKDSFYQEAFGYADLSNRRYNYKDTRFGIASGAKFFTALGIGKLIDEGKISYEDRLRDLTNLFPNFHSDVKIKHLLSHTSGIPDYFDEEVIDDFSELWIEQPMYLLREPRDFLPLLTQGNTMFSPGEKFHYNNGAYIILGIIIEEICEEKFTDFIEKHILNPADMKNSGYFPMDRLPGNTALGYYNNQQGEMISNIYSVPVVGGPDGGVFVTAEDMSRLWQKLFNGEILQQETLKIFLKAHATVQEEFCYGYGIWVQTKGDQVYKYMIMGEDPGVNFRSSYYPDTGWEVTVLCNREYGADDLSIWIEENLIGKPQ